MSGTSRGNRKVAAKIKAQYGLDEHGRSWFHTRIGSVGGENSRGGGYFKRLQAEDPLKLAEISSRGGAAKKQKEDKGDNQHRSSSKAQDDAE